MDRWSSIGRLAAAASRPNWRASAPVMTPLDQSTAVVANDSASAARMIVGPTAPSATRTEWAGASTATQALAVTTAEYFLRRPVGNVLDVGCGEGAWLPHLRALRPRVQYLGLDSSDYAVERFGRARNIRKATFGDLPKLKLGVYDLVVCSDVLHYVPDPALRAALDARRPVLLDLLTDPDAKPPISNFAGHYPEPF